MENLFGTIGTKNPKYLLKSLGGEDTDAVITVSMEPGHATVPSGAVLYRKSNGMYAPAAAANIAANYNLVVLRDEVDTTTSATVAAAAAAYRKGVFIAGKVLVNDGSNNYDAVSAAQAIVLRGQNIELSPMDDWSESETTLDNTATVTVTVTNDGHGTGSASPVSGTKGTEVTLTSTPSSGSYVFDYWEVVSGDVEVVSNKFTIADSAVTVKAHFKSA